MRPTLRSALLLASTLSHCAGSPRPLPQTAPPTTTDAGAAPRLSAEEQAADQRLAATLSRSTPGDRLAVRADLARSVPELAAGLFSRSWLAGRAGDGERRRALLEQCLRVRPFYGPCVAHTLDLSPASTTDAEYLRWMEGALAADPSATYLLPSGLEHMHDRDAAERWLRQLETRFPNNFVFDFHRGASARDRNDREGALRYLRLALSRREGFMSNGVEVASEVLLEVPNQTPAQRLEGLEALLEEVSRSQSAQGAAVAWYEAATRVRDRVGGPEAVPFFRRSYEAAPTADAAHSLYDLLRSHPATVEEHLRGAAARFPADPALQADLGHLEYQLPGNIGAAEAAFRRSLELSRDEVERAELVQRFDWDLLQRLQRFDEETTLLESVPPARRSQALWMQRFTARLRAGDLEGARARLREFHDSLGAADEVYFFAQRERFARHERAPLPMQDPTIFTPTFLAASADGRFFSSGTSPARVYDARTGRAQCNLRPGGLRAFSANGSRLAVVHDYRNQAGDFVYGVLVYEAATCALLRGYDVPAYPRSLAWNPAGTRVAWFDDNGTVTEADVDTDQRRVVRGSPEPVGGQLRYTGDGRFLVTGMLQATSLTVRRATDLGVERTLPGVSWVHSMSGTADGRLLVVADNTSTLHVWDTTDWGHRTMQLPRTAAVLAPHPSAHVLALAGFFRDHLTVVDLDQLRVLHDAPSTTDSYAAFAGPSRLLVQQANGMQTLAYPGFRLLSTRPKQGTAGLSMEVLGEGLRVAVRRTHSIAVVDAGTGRELRSWPLRGPMRRRPGTAQLVAVAGHTLHLLDTNTGRDVRHELPIDFDVQSLSVGPRRVALGGVRGEDPTGTRATPAQGTVAVFELDSGSEVWRREVPIATRPRQYARLYLSTVRVAFSEPEGRVAVATSWMDGFGLSISRTQDVPVFQLGTSSPTTLHAGSDVWTLNFVDANTLRLWGLQRYQAWDVPSGRRSGEGIFRLELPQGRFALWGRYRAELIDARGNTVDGRDFEENILWMEALPDGSVAVLEGSGRVTRLAPGG